MNKIKIIFLIVVIIVTVNFLHSQYQSMKPNFNVLLRCEEGVVGTLTTHSYFPDEMSDSYKKFNIEDICSEGEFFLNGYQRNKLVSFSFYNGDNHQADVVANYDNDIQSDEYEFYIVLKISINSPYIVIENI